MNAEREEKRNNVKKNNAIEMYMLRKYIFAAVFIMLLFCFFGVNLYMNGVPIADQVEKAVEYYDRQDREGKNEILYWADLGSSIVSKCEGAVNDNLIFSKELLWLNGFYARLQGKHEINDFKYFKDSEGYMQYAAFYREEDDNVFEYAARVRKLKDSVAANDTKVIYVITPSKYTPGKTKLPAGTPINDPNPVTDELIMNLNRLGIDTLDLRNAGIFDWMTYEDAFFKTDHHWTIPAAFVCANVLNNTLKQRFDIDLDPDGITLDMKNYRVEKYDNVMFGSMGRGSGLGFVDKEPFTAMWPKYECHFDRVSMRNVEGYEEHKYGDFTEALMHTDVFLNKDVYSDSYYSLYLNGLNYYDHIENLDYPDRPKVLYIRDSYFSPVISFLAAGCGEIDAVWSLEDTGLLDIGQVVSGDTYDLIVLETYPYNINDEAFNYFR
ncbi:MAG: hypothetical protein K6E33_00175 [Lachnospiraceae bacterium]|nr:hypothetical protein [Lachnospiraceae bacterium]